MDFKWTTDLDSTTYQDSLKLRADVFMGEQDVTLEEEVDQYEADCHHVVGYINEKIAVTGRILPLNEHKGRFQRIATRKDLRGQGYGHEVVKAMIAYSKHLNFTEVELHAQDYAIPFYEKLGFTVEGEGFMDARIPHHNMVLNIED